MRIKLTSVLVDDQDKALRFCTDVLGFEKKTDIPLGEHRWLTVVSPDDRDGTELVLEPDSHPAARPFKDALVNDEIPFASFMVDDVAGEFERLQALGVTFTQDPVEMGPVTTAASTTPAATSSKSPSVCNAARPPANEYERLPRNSPQPSPARPCPSRYASPSA